ncbi:MAG TPA: hypothetical protein VIG69_05630 [Candidatus Methylomirabilis sp.]|jgi:hypothetical protein
MLKGLGLAAVMVLVAGATATAADRPLFEFRGEVPVPGGTARLEARCDAGGDAVSCRVEGRGPSERGFRVEGRILRPPQVQSAPQPPRPLANPPQWF